LELNTKALIPSLIYIWHLLNNGYPKDNKSKTIASEPLRVAFRTNSFLIKYCFFANPRLPIKIGCRWLALTQVRVAICPGYLQCVSSVIPAQREHTRTPLT